jgi:hypothetical protein
MFGVIYTICCVRLLCCSILNFDVSSLAICRETNERTANTRIISIIIIVICKRFFFFLFKYKRTRFIKCLLFFNIFFIISTFRYNIIEYLYYLCLIFFIIYFCLRSHRILRTIQPQIKIHSIEKNQFTELLF